MAAAAAGPHRAFVYGSLLADEVLLFLFHRLPSSSPAILPDFHRYSIKGVTYPAILPAKGDSVTGKVLFGITDKELKLLDDFEDEQYRRETVKTILMNEHVAATDVFLPTFTYVWADMDDENLYGDWDYEEWRKLHLKDFLRGIGGFASGNGVI